MSINEVKASFGSSFGLKKGNTKWFSVYLKSREGGRLAERNFCKEDDLTGAVLNEKNHKQSFMSGKRERERQEEEGKTEKS